MSDQYEENLQGSVGVIERVRPPSMYKVLLLNDDFTPMDFVVLVLKKFFNKTEEEAHDIMMKVHSEGAGLAGVYPFEIAEMKSAQVNTYAQENEHPLKSIIEKE